MSETSRAAETTKKATDQTARIAPGAADMAAKAAKDTVNETNHVAEQAREAGRNLMETVAETAHAAATGMADIGFGRSHRLVASAANAMDIYRDASERSVERAQALFSSYVTVGRGLHDMRHAWLEIVDHTIERATHKPRDLFRCKNMVELAEVQRDLYLDAFNRALESTSRLIDIAGRTAQDAVRPLQQNHH
jgi:hypothetical protein